VIIATGNVPLPASSADFIFLILAAHEIRDNSERVMFFTQLCNSLRPDGRIIVVEHQRDLFNFLAYNFGFFHFLPTAVWLNNFKKSGLLVETTANHTPFLKIFILKKNGTAS
jgi:SAM-dependent methyltransferase